VLLLNGDTYFAVELDRFSEFADRNEADVAFALFETHDCVRYMATDIDATGKILRLQEKSQAPRLANGGVYWLRPNALYGQFGKADRPLSLETDLLPALLGDRRRLYGRSFSGTFIDIGVPEDFERAQNLLPPLRSTDNASC
jgi:D-glycero-alpha-D-manno-heptose 1-phosphate guanylyltransferase